MALAHASCATVKYGTPPLPPKDPTPASQCYYDKSLALVPGSSSTQIVDDSGFRVSPSAYGGVTYSIGPQTTHFTGASGYSFFLGENRLAPKEGLLKLDDPRLLTRYEQDLDHYKSGRYHVWARPAWITLMTASLVMLGVGVAQVLSAKTDLDTGKTDYGTAFPLLFGSIGAMLAVIPFIAFDLLNRDEEAELDARTALLVPDKEMGPALEAAVERHNTNVATSCGYSAPATAPASTAPATGTRAPVPAATPSSR